MLWTLEGPPIFRFFTLSPLNQNHAIITSVWKLLRDGELSRECAMVTCQESGYDRSSEVSRSFSPGLAVRWIPSQLEQLYLAVQFVDSEKRSRAFVRPRARREVGVTPFLPPTATPQDEQRFREQAVSLSTWCTALTIALTESLFQLKVRPGLPVQRLAPND